MYVTTKLRWYEYEGDNAFESTATVTEDEWVQTFFVYDYNSTSLDYYINGSFDSSHSINYSLQSNANLSMGARPDGTSAGSNTYHYTGGVDEFRISTTERSAAWAKATYYSNWNGLITFSDEEGPIPIVFYFSNPVPTDLSKVYGITTQLYLTTTVTGGASDYIYDATFYDAYDDSAIDTASGIQSGQPAGVVMSTLSGIDYQWYVTATSSGSEDTSDTYTFTNRFLCAGQTTINDTPASGIPVRLYRRSTGEYVGGTTSAGVSGTFEIDSTFNEYHYAVALYDVSNTNAVIADWLIPTASG
jgi:hypothetical protein